MGMDTTVRRSTRSRSSVSSARASSKRPVVEEREDLAPRPGRGVLGARVTGVGGRTRRRARRGGRARRRSRPRRTISMLMDCRPGSITPTVCAAHATAEPSGVVPNGSMVVRRRVVHARGPSGGPSRGRARARRTPAWSRPSPWRSTVGHPSCRWSTWVKSGKPGSRMRRPVPTVQPGSRAGSSDRRIAVADALAGVVAASSSSSASARSVLVEQ